MSPIPALKPPSSGNLGDIPESIFKSPPVNENLDKSMKREVMEASSISSVSRREIVLTLSSDDEDDDDEFDFTKIGRNPISSSKCGSRNFVYGYMYACKFLWTAHFSKNGPFSSEKVYDKEFTSKLTFSFDERDKQGPEGRQNMNLFCNQLRIDAMKVMRRGKTNNSPKFFQLANARIYFQVLVRVLSKKEVREGKNCESEMLKWLEQIRTAYCATESQYTLQLDNGGVLGRNEASYQSLDTLLMDSDVAEYAKLFYGKRIKEGSFLNDPRKVTQFFCPQNASAAKNLLG